jgi:MYXO-CTERM domain-containing protein
MRIGPLSFSVSLFVVIAASGVTPARADVPPADTCTSPGQPCQNAGAVNGPGQPGTCVEATCTKYLFHDGGLTPMTYTCHRCEAPDGGTAGGDGTAGAAGGTAGAAGGSAGAAGGAAGATATGGTSGTGGTTGSGGSAATGGATGTAGKAGGGSSAGCAVAGSPTHPARAAGALSLALLTILLARRRRSHA